ncbi:hypothetical protein ACJJTC_018921 [Scirpophaga incertulas]
MRSGGYELRKWISNSPEVLSGLPQEHQQDPHLFEDVDGPNMDVLGPASTHEAVKILQNDTFYSVATDASNHGAIKMIPLMVRFYSPTTNLKTCVLDFYEDANETASAIHMNLLTWLKECNIDTKHLTILCR